MNKELPKAYQPRAHEDAIYKTWEKSGACTPKIDPKKPRAKRFTIPMPPPNANGTLHLGHASMLAYQDILIRFHRMLGDVTLWIPGTDHAGIQTQVVFERHLEKQGKTRHDLGQEEFYKQCFAFCQTNKKTITGQIRKMGSSCDWTREKFTLDPDLVETVKKTFIQMYQDGLAYRGERIINWCVRCGTALSDIEVLHKETRTKLYTIQYGPLRIATVRPETKFGDTAVAVHPDDKRYKKYVGKKIEIETVLGKVMLRVIADKRVDPEFATGVVKITPAHDPLDFEIGKDHHLEIKQVIGFDGKLNKNAGTFAGMSVSEARPAVVEAMKEKNILVKEEEYVSAVSVCERCKNPTEPLISKQWFVNFGSIKQKGTPVYEAYHALKSGHLNIIGGNNFRNMYLERLKNHKDWNISRQIWWGPRMPVWYCRDCAATIVQLKVPKRCTKCKSKNLQAEEDTFDTWFSSGQWPYSILGGPEKTKDFSYFYPTAVLETGWDILLLWVTRMVMFGYYRTRQTPFKTVYLHGLITDKNGQKMSKSKGNGIDPIAMIDQYGTDALRLSMIIGTKPGQNLRLYEEKIAGYRNFVNKLWNIARFIMTLEEKPSQKQIMSATDRWILTKLEQTKRSARVALDNFQFGAAADALYDFVWHDFADWYIEISKAQPNISVLHHVLEDTLKLLHPFTPFITEHIWQIWKKGKSLLIAESWPQAEKKNLKIDQRLEHIFTLVRSVRNMRSEYGIQPGREILAESTGRFSDEENRILKKLARVEIKNKTKTATKKMMLVSGRLVLHIPLGDMIDIGREREKVQKEKEEATNYQNTLQKKLAHKTYLAKAPQHIIAQDRTRIEEMKAMIEKLNEKIKNLS